MNSEIDQLLHRCRAWLFRVLANALFTPYRPELHYMRGPGPKWRASIGARGNGDGTWISSPRPMHLVRRIDGRNQHDRSKPWFWVISLPSGVTDAHPWHGFEATHDGGL